jgi:hypothetical protein
MLSPFRKAPGLYFSTKQFHTAFSVPGRPTILSSSNSMINIQNGTLISNNMNNNMNNNNENLLTACSSKTEGFTPSLSTPKPSLLRSRISSSTSTFFPDEVVDGAHDGEEKTKP